MLCMCCSEMCTRKFPEFDLRSSTLSYRTKKGHGGYQWCTSPSTSDRLTYASDFVGLSLLTSNSSLAFWLALLLPFLDPKLKPDKLLPKQLLLRVFFATTATWLVPTHHFLIPGFLFSYNGNGDAQNIPRHVRSKETHWNSKVKIGPTKIIKNDHKISKITQPLLSGIFSWQSPGVHPQWSPAPDLWAMASEGSCCLQTSEWTPGVAGRDRLIP